MQQPSKEKGIVGKIVSRVKSGLRLISHKSNRGKPEKSRQKGSTRTTTAAGKGKYVGGKRDYAYEYQKYHASSSAKKARVKRRKDRKKITRKVVKGNVGNKLHLPEVDHINGINGSGPHGSH